jgi:Cu+-exporting ATPase
MQHVKFAPYKKEACFHCGEDCKDSTIHLEEKHFCCDGCKLVYEILQDNGLCKYYDISTNPGIQAKGKFTSDKFSYLDDVSIKQKLISYTDGKQSRVQFLLPQMHCSSCIWLLENLHKINPAVVKSQVDFTKKQINILYNEDGTSLRKLVELLAFVGYEPLITLNELSSTKNKKNDHTPIFKIGIAGFCFGNIMMLSFPEYFSGGDIQEKGLKEFFSYLNLFLAIPVFFYSASDFFISSWKGFRQKFINIDAPIAMAIVVTFARSVYEIISGTGAGYLDSMSGIVFFMLLGRYFQNHTYDALSFDRDYKSYFPIAVTLIQEGKETMVPVSHIRIGDRIRIKNNELVPADAILFRGEACIDYSFVTGESEPVNKILGEIIYAGGKQVGSSIELEVTKEVSQSYLTQLWNNDTFKKTKDNSDSFIHIVGKYFSIFLVALAIGSLLYWLPIDFHTGLNAFTAVLIVACPCALLLSATFTNGSALRIFGKNNLYLKNADVIERLKNIDTIVFDKTGTITQNNTVNVSFQGDTLSEQELVLIKSLATQSSHPLSKNIANHLSEILPIKVNQYLEIPGKGTEGIIEDNTIKLGSYEFIYGKKPEQTQTSSAVYVTINNKPCGYFSIKNKYREGLKQLVHSFANNNYQLIVLSGDNDGEKENLKHFFGDKAMLLFYQSPEDKLHFIQQLQAQNKNVLMLGDGLNDAGALKQSDVGIAISDNVNNFSPACDAILQGNNFNKLKAFIDFSGRSQQIIIGSFVISLLYNTVGLTLSVMGSLSPVIAAILMPLSSISIVLFTTGMSEFFGRKIFKEKTNTL